MLAINRFKFNQQYNTYVILLCHKIWHIISTEPNEWYTIKQRLNLLEIYFQKTNTIDWKLHDKITYKILS